MSVKSPGASCRADPAVFEFGLLPIGAQEGRGSRDHRSSEGATKQKKRERRTRLTPVLRGFAHEHSFADDAGAKTSFRSQRLACAYHARVIRLRSGRTF